eukprot:gnl/TRDRNA2_/TRDRNA2_38418_c0_seq1.p1 gnl/TRDRNA2_/TRDRNA2_38418_c0~~gnl/TRDRNA2_/TRDRNA2_38418_c0_seq1.p1  ORF type:complete len:457 (-),score=113.60 gnl/TRDRNA2_/TRDRNA2_38418_c0_seq1:118-1488(-)
MMPKAFALLPLAMFLAEGSTLQAAMSLQRLNSAIEYINELNEALALERENEMSLLTPSTAKADLADDVADIRLLNHPTTSIGQKGRIVFNQMKTRWDDELFPHPLDENIDSGDDEDDDDRISLFKSADSTEWTVLMVSSVLLIAFDFFVLQRFKGIEHFHCKALLFWILIGMLYNVYYWARNGHNKGLDWCSGYFLEWMLSMDNLFVFHLVFKAYNTPADQLHKALFFGIFGAVLFRMFFFVAAGGLLDAVDWVRFVFGAFLIYSGVQTALSDEDDDEDVKDTWLVRMLKSCLGSRLHDDYDKDGKFFVQDQEGRTRATLLFFIVLMCEMSDIMFAVDSVSAKVAQIPDQYVAYSSSVLAMFGLRAMFFVIEDMVDYFDLLKYGLCFILVFIGLELMFSKWVKISSISACAIILSVFIVCIAGSVVRGAYAEKKEKGEDSDQGELPKPSTECLRGG